MVGWDRNVVFMNPGDRFREARRMFKVVLDGRGLEKASDTDFESVIAVS
jgi:hypothetical protein